MSTKAQTMPLLDPSPDLEATQAVERPTRVLMIEDSPGDASLTRTLLQQGDGGQFELIWKTDMAQGLEVLKRREIDIVLLDLSLPDSEGLKTVRRVYDQASRVPLIILSADEDEERAIEAVRIGAQDYLLKGRVDHELLVRAIRYAIERKEMAHQVKLAAEAKSRFHSAISHELRIPLTAIKEGIRLVHAGLLGPIDSDQKEMLGIARNNVDRLTRLINNVLDYQKLDVGATEFHLQPGCVNDVVADVVKTMRLLAQKKGLSLATDLDASLADCPFDRDRMTQVLSNLVDNAMKFTQRGGITIRTKQENLQFIRVSVEDTGIGISAEDIPKLFNQFQQLGNIRNRKTGGTGLGLAICKEIVSHHRGKIWVESEIGRGTAFRFLLPVPKECKER